MFFRPIVLDHRNKIRARETVDIYTCLAFQIVVRITVHVSGLADCSTGPRQIEHFSSPLSDPIAEKIYFLHA